VNLLGRFQAGGGAGGGFATNLQLGDEQSVTLGLNERGGALASGQLFIGQRFQCDIANPTHLFKITHVQIVISDVAPIATLMQVGILGLDGDPPVNDLQNFYGRSAPILPVRDTTMKIELITNDVMNGDTFLTPYWLANGTLDVRQENAGANQNRLVSGQTVDASWPKIDVLTWVSVVNAQFFTVFFRRIVGQ